MAKQKIASYAISGFTNLAALAFGKIGEDPIEVAPDTPLPVAAGAPAAPSTADISSGQSITGNIDLGDQRLHRIALPAGWDAAAITFEVSATLASWNKLYDANGEVTLSASVVGAGRSIVVDPAIFFGIRYLRIRSGTSAAPVNQTALRTLTLVTVPR